MENASSDDLKNIVEECNSDPTVIDPEEYLSDSVYYYDAKKHVLRRHSNERRKKMKVKEAVEKMGGLTEGKHAYRIGFINVREEEDETELDTDCIEDLEDLWASLVSEFECEVDSITYIEPAFYDDPDEV